MRIGGEYARGAWSRGIAPAYARGVAAMRRTGIRSARRCVGGRPRQPALVLPRKLHTDATLQTAQRGRRAWQT